MAELELDFGNARIKWHHPRPSQYGDFRHAIAQLDESDWRKIAGRGTPPAGIVKVNGQAYAIGDAARRYVIPERPKGAARYKDTYYGPGLGYALASAFKKSMANVFLVASHAPEDIDYADMIRAVALKPWRVESEFGIHEFNVTRVETFDEPIGGYSNYVLTEDGMEKKRNGLRDKTVLVIDVGGFTVDIAAVDPGGQIDALSLKSTRKGIINLTSGFESNLRSNNRTLFQDSRDLDIRRVEAAILTGCYPFGKIPVDCRQEAQAAIYSLVNDVIEIINEAGGVANYDCMLMTGGGAVLIYDTLIQAYPKIDFILSEENRDLMKYSNVFGGAKLAALMRSIGVWK